MAASRDCIRQLYNPGLRFILLLIACTPLRSSFECHANSMCGSGGVCEVTGFCSFSDGSCGGGRRYGHLSGALGDLCVGEGVDGGSSYSGCASALGGGGAHACAVISD